MGNVAQAMIFSHGD
ncbi:hypothetical protein D047_1211A, partial [Vibrio parahaemolyticus VPTS-2010_2]